MEGQFKHMALFKIKDISAIKMAKHNIAYRKTLSDNLRRNYYAIQSTLRNTSNDMNGGETIPNSYHKPIKSPDVTIIGYNKL